MPSEWRTEARVSSRAGPWSDHFQWNLPGEAATRPVFRLAPHPDVKGARSPRSMAMSSRYLSLVNLVATDLRDTDATSWASLTSRHPVQRKIVLLRRVFMIACAGVADGCANGSEPHTKRQAMALQNRQRRCQTYATSSCVDGAGLARGLGERSVGYGLVFGLLMQRLGCWP